MSNGEKEGRERRKGGRDEKEGRTHTETFLFD